MKLEAAAAAAWLAFALVVSASEPWTLEKALQAGLSGNPDARIARQRVRAARAELEQASAAFWPRLEVQSSYTRTDNPMQVFGSILNQRAYRSSLDFNDVPDVDDLNVKGLVTVPLYAGGRNQANRMAARAASEAAQHDDNAIRNTLAFEIARAYYEILKSTQFIRAAEGSVSAFKSNLEIAQRRLQGESILKTELLDIEVRLGQAQEDLIRARNARALALRALRNLLGLSGGEFEVSENAPVMEAPDSSDFAARSELAAARQREMAARNQLRAAKAGYLPKVSAFGSADYDYGWKFDHGGGSYMAGALVQWDLWDGRLTRAKTRAAEANLESAREEERKLHLALDLEVERARLELKTATERLQVTERVIDQAAESAAITRARFEQGMALSTQVIDAETALLAARVRRAEAEADQRIAVAAVRKSLGLPQLDSPVKSNPQ